MLGPARGNDETSKGTLDDAYPYAKNRHHIEANLDPVNCVRRKPRSPQTP